AERVVGGVHPDAPRARLGDDRGGHRLLVDGDEHEVVALDVAGPVLPGQVPDPTRAGERGQPGGDARADDGDPGVRRESAVDLPLRHRAAPHDEDRSVRELQGDGIVAHREAADSRSARAWTSAPIVPFGASTAGVTPRSARAARHTGPTTAAMTRSRRAAASGAARPIWSATRKRWRT